MGLWDPDVIRATAPIPFGVQGGRGPFGVPPMMGSAYLLDAWGSKTFTSRGSLPGGTLLGAPGSSSAKHSFPHGTGLCPEPVLKHHHWSQPRAFSFACSLLELPDITWLLGHHQQHRLSLLDTGVLARPSGLCLRKSPRSQGMPSCAPGITPSGPPGIDG